MKETYFSIGYYVAEGKYVTGTKSIDWVTKNKPCIYTIAL